ncbi:PEP-CTERM sorting domain-containing protein [Pseudoduganella sp. FT25W]|uniref:PEP-CTERM sorting domain-containing protein n=1 Tax=Duganella alba TaxID=2666081 RepID=A0A6L5QB83_9BURK|nr:PEP_CTERM-anchored TLD domain-containing protein [Duganella alba]MRX06850.1 PEP-CTERM sorting domain-containing protein [Duganella alba]MRX16253.1 PEP-CTERM sorting domain-containing protein [Duganella alba]
MNRLLAIALLCLPLWAQGGVIVGGSQLLGTSDLGTLEHWLGDGSLTLTNIYSKDPGDIGVDFHAAADNQGPTFSLMRARAGDGSWKLIGGYNPQSWDSSNGAHYTADPRDWSAFIFNLSDDVLWRQSGPVQTYNRYFDGPTFGAMPLGPDLGVTADLSQVFSLGGWSYGGAANRGRSIVDGTLDAPNMELAALEVFTISAAVVPEPPPALLLLAGLAALLLSASLRRRPACGSWPPARHPQRTPGYPSSDARR